MDKFISAETIKLLEALKKRGVRTQADQADDEKPLDIYLPDANIYIEVDGLQNLTEPEEIIADFKRSYSADPEGFNTLRITNDVVTNNLEEIADGITEIVKEKTDQEKVEEFFDKIIVNEKA